MNDGQSIFYEESLLTAENVRDMHQQNVIWLQELINTSEEPLVILTHHLPSPYLYIKEESRNLFGKNKEKSHSGYSTDLSFLFTEKIRLWSFGHSHEHVSKYISSVHFVSNPHGYKSENLGYKDTAYIVKN